MPLDTPAYNAIPFAQDGLKNTIPNSTASEGAASFTQGFPPETMNPINAGGVPPAGRDMNGILNQLSSHQVWLNAGGMYKFDAALATAIGGYKVGAVVQSDDGLSAYVCTTNGTTTDPNDVPLPAGWSPWGGQAALALAKLAKYDVGDIYITSKVYADGDAVAEYMGGGTWVRDCEGAYLSFAGVGDGVTLVGNTTSGSYEHTITIDQTPAHNHVDPDHPIYNKFAAMGDDVVAAGDNTLGAITVTATDNASLANEIQVGGISTTQKGYMTVQTVGAGDPIPVRPYTATRFAWRRTA